MITRGSSRVLRSILPNPDVSHSVADAPSRLQPTPPKWVTDAMPAARSRELGAGVHAMESGPLVLLTFAIAGAGRMDADALRDAVAATYGSIGDALAHLQRKAIRLWNYLPDPGHPMGAGLDRYMVFNAGRYAGYRQWFMADPAFQMSLATASAVGIACDELVVHCLASNEQGRAVENPRQKPAWQYSTRYGPTPPSFSRATVATIGRRRLLLIGGTASIVGEDSVHRRDASAQMSETLTNLATLISTAGNHAESPSASLSRIRDMRVYVTRSQDAAAIGTALAARCSGVAHTEMALSRLCRPELLVEIEGIAEI